jgi:leukotriene-A4 hydrolase
MKGKSFDVVVNFETNKDQSGVYWTAKDNTRDKIHKFMFT